MLGMRKPTKGALLIPSADGYHFADDHPWSIADQQHLIDTLWACVAEVRDGRGY